MKTKYIWLILAILFICILCGTLNAQAPYSPSTPTIYGHNEQRIKPWFVQHLPVYINDSSLNTTDTSAQIRINNGKLQYHYGYWHTAGEGSGSGNVVVDSVPGDPTRFIISNGIDVPDTIVFIGDGGGGIGSDDIPRHGTDEGYPVTGDIQIDALTGGVRKIYSGDLSGNYNSIEFDDDASTFSLNKGGTDLQLTTLQIGASQISVNFGTANSSALGLEGQYDYSPNYDDLSFVQKIYADQFIDTAYTDGDSIRFVRKNGTNWGVLAGGGGSTPTLQDVITAGATLSADNTIDASTYKQQITGSHSVTGEYVLDVYNSGTAGNSNAMSVRSNGGYLSTALYAENYGWVGIHTLGTFGIIAESVGAGTAISGFNNSDATALDVMGPSSINPLAKLTTSYEGADNTSPIAMQFIHIFPAATVPVAGMGTRVQFRADWDDASSNHAAFTGGLQNEIIAEWINPSDATRESRLIFTGINGGIGSPPVTELMNNLLILNGNGDIVVPSIRSFASDAAAVADSTLPTNGLYRVTGSHTLSIK